MAVGLLCKRESDGHKRLYSVTARTLLCVSEAPKDELLYVAAELHSGLEIFYKLMCNVSRYILTRFVAIIASKVLIGYMRLIHPYLKVSFTDTGANATFISDVQSLWSFAHWYCRALFKISKWLHSPVLHYDLQINKILVNAMIVWNGFTLILRVCGTK